jgi:cytochrome c biogenesis factor
MASPDIDYQLTGDIYLAPIQFIPAQQMSSKQLQFKEGMEKRYADYVIRFTGFEVNNHAEDGELKVQANFEIEYTENGYQKKQSINPMIRMGSEGMKKIPAEFGELKFEIGKINANDRNVTLIIHDERNAGMAADVLSIELSLKPLISFMWLGTVLLGIGMLISLIYRLKYREV